MKKNLFIHIIGLITALLFGTTNYAQSSAGNPEIFDKTALTAEYATNEDIQALEKIKSINSKMFNHFIRNFKHASEIFINAQPDYTFITCKVDGIVNRVFYNKQGNLKHTIRTYESSLLSEDVADRVVYGYPGYLIYGSVEEVTIGNKTAHLVLIENNKRWKRIKVVGDEMEVYEEYNK